MSAVTSENAHAVKTYKVNTKSYCLLLVRL